MARMGQGREEGSWCVVSSEFVDVDVDVDTGSISTKSYHSHQPIRSCTYIYTYIHIIAQPISRSNSNINDFVLSTIVPSIHSRNPNA